MALDTGERVTGIEPVIGEPTTRQKRLVTTKPLFSVVFDNLVDPAVVLGILRVLEVAAGLTLLGLSGKLTAVLDASPGTVDLLTTDANNATYIIDISNATDTNIAGLVVGIVTPLTHSVVSSWDSVVGTDSSVFVHSCAVVLTQVVNLGIWLATGIWFTVKYRHWDCTSPGKLLEQYNATETTDNGLTLFDDLAFTFYKNSTTNNSLAGVIGMTDTSLFTEGIDSLFDAFNTDVVTLSLLDTDNITVSQQIVSKLSKDCLLKKGVIGVSWTGFALFVLSTVLLIMAAISKPAETPKSIVPFTTFMSTFTTKTEGDSNKALSEIMEELPLYQKEFIPEKQNELQTEFVSENSNHEHVQVTVAQVENVHPGSVDYNFLVHLTFPKFSKYSIDIERKADTLSLKSSIVADTNSFISNMSAGISLTSDCRVCLWKDEHRMVRDVLLDQYCTSKGSQKKYNELDKKITDPFDIAFDKTWGAIETYVLSPKEGISDDGIIDFGNVKEVVDMIWPTKSNATSDQEAQLNIADLQDLENKLKEFGKKVWSEQYTKSIKYFKKIDLTWDGISKVFFEDDTSENSPNTKRWKGLFQSLIQIIVSVCTFFTNCLSVFFSPSNKVMIWLFGDPIVKEATLGSSPLSDISRIFFTLKIGNTVYSVFIKCDPKPVTTIAKNAPSNTAPVSKRLIRRFQLKNEVPGNEAAAKAASRSIKEYKRDKVASKRFSRSIMLP